MTRQIVRSFRPELRVGTTAQWAASTLILREGEPGVEYNGEKDVVGIKIGDGIRLWSALEYATTGGSGGGGSGPDLSDATPQAIGTAAAGTSDEASRADHVHAGPAAPTSEELANENEAGIRSWSPARLWDLVQAWYLGQAPNIPNGYDPPFKRALNTYLLYVEALQTTWGAIDPVNFASVSDRRFGSTLIPLGVVSNSALIKGPGQSWEASGVISFGTNRGTYTLTIDSTAAFSLDVSDTLGNPTDNWEAEIRITTTQVPESFTFTGTDTVIVVPGSALTDEGRAFVAGGVTSLYLAKRNATSLTAQFSPATVDP